MSPRTARYVWACALGPILFALLLAYVGPGKVAQALLGAAMPYVVLGVLCYAAFFLLRGLRWGVLLAPPLSPATRVATTASLSAAGWLVSTFVPFKAGDFARAALLSRRLRAPLASVAATVAVERALDVLGVALAATVGLWAAGFLGAPGLPPMIGRALAFAWLLPPLGLLGLLVLGRWTKTRPARNRVFHFAATFFAGIELLVGRREHLVRLVLLTTAIAAAQVAVFVLLVRSLLPNVPLGLLLAGVPFFLLSFVVSVVPGNVGTYEASFVAIFALLGLGVEALIPVAVALHVLTSVTVVWLGSVGFAVFSSTASHTPQPLPEVAS